MKQTLVSVIVPVFNGERYLAQCLDSILVQEHEALELIVVDDGSSDRTAEICRDYAARDPRVRLLRQDNRGVSAARNLGLSHAAGTWITFADCDDWLDRDHLSGLLAAAEGADCVVCGYRIETSGGTEVRLPDCPARLTGDEALSAMLSPCGFQGFLWNKLFRAQRIRQSGLKLAEDIYYFEDLLFCAQYFSACREVRCVSRAGCHYRQHRDSAIGSSGVTREQLARRLTAVQALRRVAPLCATDAARRLCRARVCMEQAQVLGQKLCASCGREELRTWKRTLRGGIGCVLRADLKLKTKLRYLSTALFPAALAPFWVRHDRRGL